MEYFSVLPSLTLEHIFVYLSDEDFVNLCATLEDSAKFTKRRAVISKLQELLHRIEWIDDYLQILIPRNLEDAPFSRLFKAIQYYKNQWRRCKAYSPEIRTPKPQNISLLVVSSPLAEACFADTLLSLKDENGMNIFRHTEGPIPVFKNEISGYIFSCNVIFNFYTSDFYRNVNEHYDGLIYEICMEKLSDYWLDPTSWLRPDTIIKRHNFPTLLFLDEFRNAITYASESSLLRIQRRNFNCLRTAYRLMLDISVRDIPAATFPHENCRLWHFYRERSCYRNLFDALRFLFMKIVKRRH